MHNFVINDAIFKYSRSGSRSPVSKGQRKNANAAKASAKQAVDSKTASKALPGRQVSNFSLKKAAGKMKRLELNLSLNYF